MKKPAKRPLSDERAIAKHEKLLASLLVSPAKPEVDILRKAAGSAARICVLRDENFEQLVERLHLSDHDARRLRTGGAVVEDRVRGVRFYLERLGHGHRYTARREPSKIEMAVAKDALYKRLSTGAATASDQRSAAEWIKWMSRFVPLDQFEKRRDGEADDLM